MGYVSTKTDNQAHVGRHVFEVSGCGIPPFRLVGADDLGGICYHCGATLKIVGHIQDANGKTFSVGRVCVQKTGDKGLIKAFVNAPEIRAMKREKAWNKTLEVRGEIRCLIDEYEAALREIPYIGKEGHLLGYAEWALLCGFPSFQKRFLIQLRKRFAQ